MEDQPDVHSPLTPPDENAPSSPIVTSTANCHHWVIPGMLAAIASLAILVPLILAFRATPKGIPVNLDALGAVPLKPVERAGTAASAPGRLVIRTEPTGATLIVDGQEQGSTPAELEALPGQHSLLLRAEGYRPYETQAWIRADEITRFDFVLQRDWPTSDNPEPVDPLAVIVENQDAARPQTGLDRADVVYEALAEGGITRFLALYDTEPASTIGPVRSARDYFVNWAREYGAPLVHIGASPQGYATIRSAGVPTLDETYGDPGFWRIASRQAPHNAYTSTAGAWSALNSRVIQDGSFGGLVFKDDASRHTGPAAPQVHLDFGWDDYWVDWIYDPDTNSYGREINGAPHLDAATGNQIVAQNVIAEWVDSSLIQGDDAGRLQFRQIGTGPFVALVDGVRIDGQWSKQDAGSATEYRDSGGHLLTLNAGPTWIEIIPLNGTVQL